MATRFYIPSVGTAVTQSQPFFDAGWESTSGVVRRRLVRAKENSAYSTITVTKSFSTNPMDILFTQLVSPPLRAQTISSSGFMKGIFQVSCSSASTADAQVMAKVYSNDGGTSRGTILAMQSASLSNAFDTDKANRKFPLNFSGSGATLTQVTAQENDIIVIEIGVRFFTASTGLTASIQIGDPSGDSDLEENETDTEDGVPWIEFSQDLLFADDMDVLPTTPVDPGKGGVRVRIRDESWEAGAMFWPDTDRVAGAAQRPGPQRLIYRMRGRDVDCPRLTYRYWSVTGEPDVNATMYKGPKCGPSPLADVTVMGVEVTT